MSKRNGSNLRFQTGARSAPAVPTGKKQRLQIERLANDGRGIGFVDGRTWFVAGALPGEEVEARVLGARAQVVEARTQRVLRASEQRRQPPCAHADSCGGCSLQHLPHADQLALKQRALEEQFSRAGVVVAQWAAPLVGPELGYRRRARIAVRWDPQQRRLALGFRAEASQEIVDIEHCPVLVQPLQILLGALPALLAGFARPRVIGHVELFQGDASVLLLRHTAPLEEGDLGLLRAFCAQHRAQLWLQGNGEPQSDQPQDVPGYRLDDGLRLAWRPGDFVQVNAGINQAMVSQALDWLAPQADERILDLFCGLGNFALPLARRAREVVGVEGVEGMVERATANARENALGNLHFYRADLSKPLADAPWAAQGFAALLLDPPRDGAFEVVRRVASLGVRRVLYVSCNPATLARDAAELVRQGLQLKRAGMLDMFPQTGHVEAMALFEADQFGAGAGSGR